MTITCHRLTYLYKKKMDTIEIMPSKTAPTTPPTTAEAVWNKRKTKRVSAFARRPYCTVTLNLNFAILKPEIVLNSSKRIFEPIVFQRKANGFLLHFKAFSWETQFLTNTRGFYGKNAKMGRKSTLIWKLIM